MNMIHHSKYQLIYLCKTVTGILAVGSVRIFVIYGWYLMIFILLSLFSLRASCSI